MWHIPCAKKSDGASICRCLFNLFVIQYRLKGAFFSECTFFYAGKNQFEDKYFKVLTVADHEIFGIDLLYDSTVVITGRKILPGRQSAVDREFKIRLHWFSRKKYLNSNPPGKSVLAKSARFLIYNTGNR
jgi:hypothetical protein